jgi:hypothetical protein
VTNTQHTLWGNEPAIARSRHSDPVTSHEAAQRVERSGSGTTNREKIMAAIRDIPGRTSAELAADLGMDRVEAARRCGDLKKSQLARHGEPRECRVNDTRAVTWFPV